MSVSLDKLRALRQHPLLEPEHEHHLEATCARAQKVEGIRPPAGATLVSGWLGGDAKAALQLSSQLQERLGKATPDHNTSPQMLAELRAKNLMAHGSAALRLRDTKTARADFDAAHTAAAVARWLGRIKGAAARAKSSVATKRALGMPDASLDNVLEKSPMASARS